MQFTAFELGRPYFVSDGVPADRVAALRRAFDLAMKDKDLLADADKLIRRSIRSPARRCRRC